MLKKQKIEVFDFEKCTVPGEGRQGPCGNRTRDLSHPKRESYL